MLPNAPAIASASRRATPKPTVVVFDQSSTPAALSPKRTVVRFICSFRSLAASTAYLVAATKPAAPIRAGVSALRLLNAPRNERPIVPVKLVAAFSERLNARSSERLSPMISTSTLRAMERLEVVEAAEQMAGRQLAHVSGADGEEAEAGIPVGFWPFPDLSELVGEASPEVVELPDELTSGGPASSSSGCSSPSKTMRPLPNPTSWQRSMKPATSAWLSRSAR